MFKNVYIEIFVLCLAILGLISWMELCCAYSCEKIAVVCRTDVTGRRCSPHCSAQLQFCDLWHNWQRDQVSLLAPKIKCTQASFSARKFPLTYWRKIGCRIVEMGNAVPEGSVLIPVPGLAWLISDLWENNNDIDSVSMKAAALETVLFE